MYVARAQCCNGGHGHAAVARARLRARCADRRGIGTGIRADAFFVAFQLANLVRRVLAEGALNAAVVPLYLRERDNGGDARPAAFAGRLIGTLTIGLLGLAALLLALFMPLLVHGAWRPGSCSAARA